MDRRAFLARAAVCATGVSAVSTIQAQPSDRLDVVVKGGTVLDPANAVHGTADVGIRAGRIAALEPDIAASRAARVIDARAHLVTPGLIDFQTHIYPARAGGRLIADDAAGRSAVTTWVSVADASIHELMQFRRFAASHTRCRVYAFVHLGRSSSATTKGAASDPAAESIEALGRLLSQHRDVVLGVSVGPPGVRDASGDDGQALQQAISVAVHSQARARVMASFRGVAPWVEQLRPGDVLTHAYSGGRDGLLADGKMRPELVSARARGVIISVGAGMGPFDPSAARSALEQGFVPDVLTSAVAPDQTATHAGRRLTDVMSRFLNLGLSLEQVLAMTTANPARVLSREPKLGTLELGAPADLSMLQLIEGPVQFTESNGDRWPGTRALRPIGAIRAGMHIA